MKIIFTFFALLAAYAPYAYSQTITTLTGQYGCILNKNFGGYNLANIKNTEDGGITGSNYLIFFDFTNKKMEMNVIGLKTWGVSKIVTGSVPITNGIISLNKGPLTNTFTVTGTFTAPGQTFVSSYNLMPVNGGATLLLQEGIGATGDGEPSTGACNKI